MQPIRLSTMEEVAPMLQALLAEQKQVLLTVTGNSMYPLFRSGADRVLLEKPKPAPLKRGDIALYQRPNGKYVLHRVMKVQNGAYWMAGDAQTDLEKGVAPDSVVAVVCAFERNGRRTPCRSGGYRIYSQLWMLLRPLRRPIFKTRAWAGRLLKKCCGK